MNENKWKQCQIRPDESIRVALQILSQSMHQILVVTDASDRLLGTITDGDIRRALLNGRSIETAISQVMRKNPRTMLKGTCREDIVRFMRLQLIRQLPIVDSNDKVVDLVFLDDYIFPKRRENIVVLMAGGLGTRLRPLTEECPKPLLRVGNKPILETILKGFASYGFHRFYLAVNYKASMIEEYFGDGSSYGVEIAYMHEKKRMGTAGALSLLPACTDLPVFVMNGDLLTRIDFDEMLGFHEQQKASATMAVREYSYQVPYGVIDCDGNQIVNIVEKPVQTYYVNAGIYILSPWVINQIPQDTFLDMPDIFKQLIQGKKTTTIFPVSDYWLDIGRMDDFERANSDFASIFQ